MEPKDLLKPGQTIENRAEDYHGWCITYPIVREGDTAWTPLDAIYWPKEG